MNTDNKVPEPFHTWLCYLNNCLNILRHNNYDHQTRGYAETIHKSYRESFSKWESSAQPADIEGKPEAKGDWNLIGHSHQIADTGDYDGCYEITDGKISIFSKDDEEESLLPIVKALNESGAKFYLDDSIEFENHLLKMEIENLKPKEDIEEKPAKQRVKFATEIIPIEIEDIEGKPKQEKKFFIEDVAALFDMYKNKEITIGKLTELLNEKVEDIEGKTQEEGFAFRNLVAAVDVHTKFYDKNELFVWVKAENELPDMEGGRVHVRRIDNGYKDCLPPGFLKFHRKLYEWAKPVEHVSDENIMKLAEDYSEGYNENNDYKSFIAGAKAIREILNNKWREI